uniref:Uncharacterized protein n=1 Tax=Strigamia maritima TaxID=126957 RepID=T1IYN1_STRMM
MTSDENIVSVFVEMSVRLHDGCAAKLLVGLCRTARRKAPTRGSSSRPNSPQDFIIAFCFCFYNTVYA